MSRVFTENSANANFGSGLVCPTNGESGTQWWVEYEAMFQQLADRHQFLLQLSGASSLGSGKYRVPVGLAGGYLNGFAQQTELSGSASVRVNQQSTSDHAHFALPRLGLAKIDGYGMYCYGRDPSGGPHTVLPTTMPKIKLIRQPYTAGGAVDAAVTVDTTTDGSATIAAYDVQHTVSQTGLAHSIVSTSRYYLTVSAESGGTGGQFGFTALWVDVTL